LRETRNELTPFQSLTRLGGAPFMGRTGTSKGFSMCPFVLMTLPALAAPAVEGLISVPSADTVANTAGELERLVKARGLNVFTVVDHAAGAVSVGMSLRPAMLIIFGNPKGGTPLMQCAPSMGLDLPLKMLVREDENGRVWIEYNDPAWVAARHHAGACPSVEGVGH